MLHAARQGEIQTVEKLLSFGADVHHVDVVGRVLTLLFIRSRAAERALKRSRRFQLNIIVQNSWFM